MIHANGWSRWSIFGGIGIALLGTILLLIPIRDRDSAIFLTGGFLIASALIELALALKIAPGPFRRIWFVMSGIALGAAALILVRPEAYPLVFVATFCLAIRGVGAVAAASILTSTSRWWILGRGFVDLLLTIILVASLPLAAVISIIAGTRWPPEGPAVLANFLGLSLLVTGVALVGAGLTTGRAGDRGEHDPTPDLRR